MEFENEDEELDRATIDRLETYGIWPKRGGQKITKEKALVLIGEAMLEDFMKRFMNLWRNELFPNCLLKEYDAPEKEIYETVFPCEPWESRAQKTEEPGHSALCSNECKEVDEKMDENTKEKLTSYMELLGEIKEKTEDERTAVSLLQEISKDIRSERIKTEREANNSEPATDKQKKFMKKLGIDFPETVTKQEASLLIDEELGKNGG